MSHTNDNNEPRYEQPLFEEWALKQPSLMKAKTTLADRADISVSMAEQLIKGTYRGLPSLDRQLRIAGVIGKPAKQLFRQSVIRRRSRAS